MSRTVKNSDRISVCKVNGTMIPHETLFEIVSQEKIHGGGAGGDKRKPPPNLKIIMLGSYL